MGDRLLERLRILGGLPSTEELEAALVCVAERLDQWTCYHHLERFHFPLGSGWSIAVSTESAGRIKVETCLRARPMLRMWSLAHDRARLASLVERLANEVAEPV